jgi:hypothetical protein
VKRALLAVFFAALLLGQPATAAGYPSAADACGQTGGGETLVAVFPGDSQAGDGDSQVVTAEDSPVGVYAGTEFRVALCKNGDLKRTRGSEWSLDPSPGLNVTDRDDATVTVRVTGETDSIDVTASKKDLPNVSLAVRRPPTAEVAVGDDPVTLAFESRQAASEYETDEQQYLAARQNLTAATERLNRSAAALRSGGTVSDNVTAEVLPALERNRNLTDERATALTGTLYDTAWHSADAKALTAMTAVETSERTATADARNAMDNYLGALKAAERNAQTTVLFNFGGAAILGLLVGAVPGWWLTERKLEDVRFDQEVNSSVSYGPRLLAQAGGLAVLALVATLAILVALGGLANLGGLL